MKSSVRTISVFAVLILVTGSFILAQDTPRKVEDVEAARRNIVVQETTRVKEDETALKAIEERLRKEDERLKIERIQKLVVGTTSQYGAGRVLVIPTEQINPKQLLTITEDLNIMSRILDRKLDDAGLGRDYDWYYGENFLEWNIPVTKCIYLQGHAVLFLKKVNFPLSPPVEPNAIEKIKQDYDPVWEQTRQQMYFRRDLFEQRHRKGRSKEQYDARKVETLKRTLIETLRHAANIRELEDDDLDLDWVIVTVVGESGNSGRVLAVTPDKHNGRVILTRKSGDRVDTTVYPNGEAYMASIGPSSPTVMTMRVNKSDIDEFYEGKINFDEFRHKVEIFTY